MKISAFVRWVGPAAIAGGVLMVFSDLLNLTIYVPGLGEAAHTGYQAVGSGVILFALTLLLVGMVGLYARSGPADGARVIEYGDGHARYVLAEFEDSHLAMPAGERARAIRAQGVAMRRHRAARRIRRA